MRRFERRVVDGETVMVRVPDDDSGASEPPPETGERGNLAGSFEAFLGAFAPGQLSAVELDALCDSPSGEGGELPRHMRGLSTGMSSTRQSATSQI